MVFSRLKIKGFTLLEVAFVISIAALIMLLAIRYYTIAKQRERINAAYNMIDAVYTAGQQYYQVHGNFSSTVKNYIPQFLLDGYLPPKFGLFVKNTSNPWGGAISAYSSQNHPDWFTIELDGVPTPAVNAMFDKYTNVVTGWLDVKPQKIQGHIFSVTFHMGS